MFSWRSLKENAELTERFPILENGRLIQDLSGIHRLGKLTVNEGFLAVISVHILTKFESYLRMNNKSSSLVFSGQDFFSNLRDILTELATGKMNQLTIG